VAVSDPISVVQGYRYGTRKPPLQSAKANGKCGPPNEAPSKSTNGGLVTALNKKLPSPQGNLTLLSATCQNVVSIATVSICFAVIEIRAISIFKSDDK
jgi:hypothetical protein